jgi:glycosyltransferase involved in cell wall biosynthesis
MRVLLLTQFYWPEERSAPKNLAAVAEYLVAKGHEVEVVTGFPNHPFGRLYPGYRMTWRQWQDVNGVRVLRLPLYPDHSLSVVRRSLHYGSFALSAATLGAFLTRKFQPDVLLVYLPPLTNWLPLRVLQWVHGIPVVLWETDLWPEALTATGNELSEGANRVIRALDRAVHRHADKICLNSKGLVCHLANRGISPDRLAVITDWADESLFYPVEPCRDLAARFGLDGKFNAIYGGNFGPAQDLGTVIHAAALLADLEDFQLVLIGSGEEESHLRKLIAENNFGNVRFVPRQPMGQIRNFYALAETLVVHLKPATLFELQVPSKIMAYLACSRPIVCAINGEAAEVVRKAGAGLCCPPGDAAALAQSMRSVYEMTPEHRRVLGASGRDAYLAQYTLGVQAQRIERILSAVAR